MSDTLTWLSIIFVALPWGVGIGLGILLVAIVALRVVTWWSNRGWNKPTEEARDG